MTPWAAKSDDTAWKRKSSVRVAITDNDPVNARILKLATDLGNTVLAKKAANDLQTSVLPSQLYQFHANNEPTVSKLEEYPGSANHPFSTR